MFKFRGPCKCLKNALTTAANFMSACRPNIRGRCSIPLNKPFRLCKKIYINLLDICCSSCASTLRSTHVYLCDTSRHFSDWDHVAPSTFLHSISFSPVAEPTNAFKTYKRKMEASIRDTHATDARLKV